MTNDKLKQLKSDFPELWDNDTLGSYGVSVDDGWYDLLRVLSSHIVNTISTHNDNVEYAKKHNKKLAAGELYPLYEGHVPKRFTVSKKIPPVQFVQVKEKFGLLRVYYDGGNKTIANYVSMAESISGIVCECCGKPGKMRNGGWLKTLCDDCDAARKQR